MVILSQVHKPSLIMRKTSDKSQLRDSLQNTWPGLLKTVKVIKHKETEKLSQPRGAKGDVTTKCNVAFWMGPWNRKRILGKN